ncbi:hypothetical protein GKO32_09490 [Amycolatopsis sp. RM579]|uniref:Putative zinc-finger domain-containing protein n=2 Tax=Amycolatopsis pithecellobii TaxID=664692 RepID=A0A6N7Z4M8_9PSEU|nr:hypothetical protein [Amycolatopsis pithecellobii]
MDCSTAREAISAMLDGEDPGVSPAELDAHVAGCADCTAWQHEAATVNRLVRMEKATETPDFAGDAAIRFAPPSRPGPVDWPRWALVLTAIAQFSIVVAELFLPQPMPGGMQIEPGSHVEHEAVAFNFAVGVALLWVASRPRNARTQLPVLLSFTLVLAVLSTVDFIGGEVGWYRLASHVPLLLGVLCTALIGAREGRWPWPGGRADGQRTSTKTQTRLGQPGHAPTSRQERRPPAAHRDVA